MVHPASFESVRRAPYRTLRDAFVEVHGRIAAGIGAGNARIASSKSRAEKNGHTLRDPSKLQDFYHRRKTCKTYRTCM